MKTLLLLFLLISNFSFSQDSTQMTFYQPDKVSIGNDVPYIVGSKSIPGYELEIRACEPDSSVNLPNGRRIAGLNCIISEVDKYQGGLLIFNQDTTVILNIIVEPSGSDDAKFSVEGKDFSMGFTLINGIILAYENRYCVFNTKGLGIWRIEKK